MRPARRVHVIWPKDIATYRSLPIFSFRARAGGLGASAAQSMQRLILSRQPSLPRVLSNNVGQDIDQLQETCQGRSTTQPVTHHLIFPAGMMLSVRGRSLLGGQKDNVSAHDAELNTPHWGHASLSLPYIPL